VGKAVEGLSFALDFVEIVRAGSSRLAFVTCEHASGALPAPWSLPLEDSWLEGTHWTHDLGAADLARELAAHLSTVAVLANFSRLLADPNRPFDSPDVFRTTAEGRVIAMNRAIDSIDRDRRLILWQKYHDTVHRELAESPAAIVLAAHTFTPNYEGSQREMEIGVLFDGEAALAETLRRGLVDAGLHVAMNAPYSGKDGLMYSVDRHARTHGRRAIELELRQDLAVDPRARRRVTEAVARALDEMR